MGQGNPWLHAVAEIPTTIRSHRSIRMAVNVKKLSYAKMKH